MENLKKNIPLTSAEISSLWTSYQNETMTICGIKYFLQHVDDDQIQSILEQVLAVSEENKSKLTNFFNNENYPIPHGYTEKDIDLQAPRLFADKLYLEYMLNLTILLVTAYGTALGLAERTDVIKYYSNCLNTTQGLHSKIKELSKEKGIYIRSPKIPKPRQIDFVKKQKFLSGWFGDRRPLLGIEIANLVFHAKRNALGQAVIAGFSQVAKSKEAKRYFERGRDISGKHVNIFTSILHEEYLSNGTLLLLSEVTDSTVPPFSDKLMMSLVTLLTASGIGQYGMAMSASPRHDLGVHYTRLIAEVAHYSDDGANIMINNGWMEQPPIAADRKELAE
ncbi:DUF3231 family protein [Virgibacillus litoralis]|uniref:DUF3231 family protein n=1 Tax=Virgibacillus litoralis TaxID=578221 RepID=A0ABS4HBI7_9BACI|nr:DUF3231 family protein [Virgibacillus litoralis]MBP1948267.1 hypothetical protein [Virgibacillus litoralis]